MPTRRQLLSVAGLLVGAAVTGCSVPAVPGVSGPVPRERVRGADLSFTLQTEAIGARYRDGGAPAPLERLLAARGANLVRLRAWVNPPAGYSTLESALTLGRRAHDAGCDILLDLHYSDFWADQYSQSVPAVWAHQDLGRLAGTVRDYTRDAVAAFARQGTPLSMIQTGNEITTGMLWPVGKVYERGHEQWDGFVRLLTAGLAGALDGATAPLETMVHIDRGGDNGGARYFYDAITARGVEFDLIGLSYYPFWHGSLDTLAANLGDLAVRYGKDVLVVETSYPWTLRQADGTEYYAARLEELPDAARFPATPEGQAAYFEGLRTVVDGVPDGHGRGFVAWEPGWLPGVGWDHGEGNPYANLTMFDWTGTALPSLAAFRA
ncbi:arabinogalactan endo-beta-1,4-galactanase [Pseudonocardia sp. RS010]|uniref:glycoside hydrolase family 53 protein n=1 Tax=Pseudonocardia sp. RS010 TaxID=3385979 RepID=UPI00399F5CF1